jgi:hypothetical protein
MEEFELDERKPYGLREITVVERQTTIRGFTIDINRTKKCAYKGRQILERLIFGWGLRDFKPHTVITRHDIPTAVTLKDTFGTSSSLAWRVLKQLRERLQLHMIDYRKRSKRGDWLQKMQRQMKQEYKTQVSLSRFFNPNRLHRMEIRARRNR